MSFYSYWLLVNIRSEMGNWENLKRKILENDVNVQKQPQEVLNKNTVIKYVAIIIEKQLCFFYFNFFLIRMFQCKCFPLKN